jgi:hypothetical protein
MINWQESKYFKKEEFNIAEVLYMDPLALKKYNLARAITNVSWYPSKTSGALARFDGSKTSRHYAVGRLSDAMDFFPARNADLRWFLYQLIGCGLFGGIGVYFDKTGYSFSSDIMFHVDCRRPAMGFPLVWFRDDKKYNYVINNQSLKNLCERLCDVV